MAISDLLCVICDYLDKSCRNLTKELIEQIVAHYTMDDFKFVYPHIGKSMLRKILWNIWLWLRIIIPMNDTWTLKPTFFQSFHWTTWFASLCVEAKYVIIMPWRQVHSKWTQSLVCGITWLFLSILGHKCLNISSWLKIAMV